MIPAQRKMFATNKMEKNGFATVTHKESILDKMDTFLIKWWNRIVLKRAA